MPVIRDKAGFVMQVRKGLRYVQVHGKLSGQQVEEVVANHPMLMITTRKLRSWRSLSDLRDVIHDEDLLRFIWAVLHLSQAPLSWLVDLLRTTAIIPAEPMNPVWLSAYLQSVWMEKKPVTESDVQTMVDRLVVSIDDQPALIAEDILDANSDLPSPITPWRRYRIWIIALMSLGFSAIGFLLWMMRDQPALTSVELYRNQDGKVLILYCLRDVEGYRVEVSDRGGHRIRPHGAFIGCTNSRTLRMPQEPIMPNTEARLDIIITKPYSVSYRLDLKFGENQDLGCQLITYDTKLAAHPSSKQGCVFTEP